MHCTVDDRQQFLGLVVRVIIGEHPAGRSGAEGGIGFESGPLHNALGSPVDLHVSVLDEWRLGDRAVPGVHLGGCVGKRKSHVSLVRTRGMPWTAAASVAWQ